MELIAETTGLGGLSLIWCLGAVFAAAAIRAYSGFGLSALLVTSLSLVLPPAEIVPVMLLLEAAASLALFPAIRRDLDWTVMRPLLAGAVPALPLGAWLLASLPDAAMRALLSLLVLAATVAVWRGFRFRETPGAAGHGAAGVVSGAMFGAAAIGGLPVVAWLLACSAGAGATRAILALLLLLMGLYGAMVTGAFGLLGVEGLWRAGLFLPPLLAGVALGNKRFLLSNQESWRRVALGLLVLLAAAGLVRALLA